jgi:hypothetical protein
MDNPVPTLSAETIRAEDRLFDAVDRVSECWLDARDSLVEELERREGMPLPPGVDRCLDALRRLEQAERQARGEFVRVLSSLSRNDAA